MKRFELFECPSCNNDQFNYYSNFWSCTTCGKEYELFEGIPRFYNQADVNAHDKFLKKYFYEGFLGKFYFFLMPFLTLPARPFKISVKHWIALLSFYLLVFSTAALAIHFMLIKLYIPGIVFSSIFVILITFLVKNTYLLSLLITAIPTKISLKINKFTPKLTFKQIHDNFQEKYKNADSLKILDVSTGTCNSLFRHGWMSLNAEYTGVDLSETMITKGKNFMTSHKIKMDFALCDAAVLPFKNESFDIVLNYGALNAYSDINKALKEMTRVLKKGGEMLILDEELYTQSTFIEKYYFKKVLAKHDLVDHCPVELFPENLKVLEKHQVYQFYYICIAKKTD